MTELTLGSIQMFAPNSLESVYEFNGVNGLVETEIDPYSIAQEILKFNYEATFSAEMTVCPPLLSYTTDLSDKPLYLEYSTPIMVQARWHKKPRINKKWLKRYGMKKDAVLVRCNVESVSPSTCYDPLYMTEHVEYGMTFSNMEYKFRPDQLRRNLKLEAM